MAIRTVAKAQAATTPDFRSIEAEDLATAFKALSDPTRIRIVSMLQAAGESGLCVCDIVAHFPLGQPTISHHLKTLKNADILCARKKGLWVYYSVNTATLSRLGISLPYLEGPVNPSNCTDDCCSTPSAANRIS